MPTSIFIGGNSPLSRLLFRYNITSRGSLNNPTGISPESWFEASFLVKTIYKLIIYVSCSKQAGIDPFRAFPCKYSKSKRWQLQIEVGIGPYIPELAIFLISHHTELEDSVIC
jgi:hypothetical protein